MSSTQQHWFTLSLAHTYFAEQQCRVFEVKPTPSTLRILKNYGIRLQMIGSVIRLHAEVRPNRQVWEELATAEDLYFQLVNTDPTFDNYTEVVLPKKEDTVAYMTNAEVSNRLHEVDATIPTYNLPISPLRFGVEVDKDAVNTIQLKQGGQVVYEVVSLKKQGTARVDISALGQGVYELWVDGEKRQQFFGTTDSLESQVYGLVHINMRNSVESLKENAIPELKVQFQARKTYREYVVVLSPEKMIEIKNMEVEGTSTELYDEIEKKEIIEGQGLTDVFRTTQPVPLRQKATEHPVLKIQYVNQYSDVMLDLDIKLPVADASMVINRKKNNEDIYVSQTIIYV